MKLTKQNVRVFIKNEAQLQEAKKLLEIYNQPIFERWFNLEYDFYYLFFDGIDWWIGSNDTKELITLSELETILKNEAK